MTAIAVSKKIGRPVKFMADRLESFTTDIHARCHKISGKLGVDKTGKILAMEINDLSGIGPYSMYPRTSAIETNQVLNLSGAPYLIPNYKAVGTVVFQNKTPMCQYRAVGHPIAVAITEALVDKAAMKIGLQLDEIRKLNFIPDNAYPNKTPSGVPLEDLSHQASMEKLLTIMNVKDIERQKKLDFKDGILSGYGIISMCEVTNPSPLFYGVGGAHISAQDGASIRLEGSGAIHLSSSITEQGQGTEAIMKQIAADQLGVTMDTVRVTLGDTDATPYGGGTWASRGAGIGGEAVLKAARILKNNILEIAAAIMQTDIKSLDIEDNIVIRKNGGEGITLQQLAQTVYYRGHELPQGTNPELLATASFLIEGIPFVFTNSAMGCHISIDQETGLVKINKFWVVEDCGTQINPKLVEEQIRGGVVQGIGGALYEECVYDDQGNMQNATMADYLVPMAYEMPDIIVDHVTTNSGRSIIGAKGAGEAGTGGAPAVIMNAINNALKDLNIEMTSQPITPEKILKKMGKI
jgi:carbon-monoxide dehydrogenase large subunit